MESIVRSIVDSILTAAAACNETARRIDEYRMPGWNGDDRQRAVVLYASLGKALVETAGTLVFRSVAIDGTNRDALESASIHAFDAAFAGAAAAIDEAIAETATTDSESFDFNVDDLLDSLDIPAAADEDIPDEER